MEGTEGRTAPNGGSRGGARSGAAGIVHPGQGVKSRRRDRNPGGWGYRREERSGEGHPVGVLDGATFGR